MEIIFENDNFLALNKPAGLMVHSDGKNNNEKNLADWLLENYPFLEGVGEDIFINENIKIKKPGLVHRLDKDTSGIILVAKNQDSFLFLKNQFKNREIKKNYKCFVYGKVKIESKIIKTNYGRSKNDFKKWTAHSKAIRGKVREAETYYEFVFGNNDFSFLSVYPKTGRTHQIRVHLKYDNHPIVSDFLYAGKKISKNPENNLYFNRQALHAHKISFKDLSGKLIELEAPYPEDFKKALSLFKESF